jgi:hypothetical protein
VGVALKLTIFACGNFALRASQLAATFVVALIELDEVEKIIGQILKPTVSSSLKLVDVGNHNIGCLKVRLVRCRPANFDGFRIRLAVQHITFDIEHIRAGRIKIFLKLFCNRHTWRDDKRPGGLKGEWG